MERNYLYMKGIVSNYLNALMSGYGRNLRKLLKILLRFVWDNPF